MFRFQEIESLGEAAIYRDYRKLNRLRSQFFALLYFRRSGHLPFFDEARYLSTNPADDEYRNQVDHYILSRVRAADILCYMVLIQSVFIDRQIKQDMKILHERRGFAYGAAADRSALDTPAGAGLRFYDFKPTPEAKFLFREYVKTKWPIRVFALDPDIDQQNILDAYSQRTELQMALSVALSAGKINFKDAAKYARRLELDMTTIGLNRTSVGFGAGRSTFGWKFYPRVQSPPDPSNPTRFIGALLYNGTKPDYDLVHRQIEPGQHECVALMVIPNFVPKIRMTSDANWFGLGAHGSPMYDPDDRLRLSAKLQSAKQTLALTQDNGQHLPGELERMADRIDQLEHQLPSQSFQVELPDESDFSGSEIFSSDAANLSPTLLTWFGEPPTINKASDVFLVGKGFSVLESQVIAGGVYVSPI